ncbi:MAG: RNA-binding domain-containing protein [Bacteroidota bacterium]
MSETNRIEYKRELTPEVDIEKEVIAFLNYPEGGLIYVGMDAKGKPVGVLYADADMLKLKDRIKNNIAPSAMGLFDVVLEQYKGKDIIKVIVASGNEKPYFKKKYGMTEKGCYMRLGTASEPMPKALIEKLFASRTRNSIGKIKSQRQELSFEQLRIYFQEKGKPLNKQFKKNLELLTEDENLNYAAYLLADENNFSVKVAKYKGNTRTVLIENNEYGLCSLVKAAKSVLDKFDLENKTTSTITAKSRTDKRLWNPIALREAIINAFVHSDYTLEVPPKFEIFTDRVEITSAGSLPEGLSKKEFFEGYSVPRNKELMRVFKDLQLVEQLGSGIPRILESYNKRCFKFSDNFLRMVLTIANVGAGISNTDNQTGGQTGGQIGGQIGGAINDLTDRQKEVLQLITLNTKLSRKELAEKLGINESAVQKHLKALTEEKIIERVGTKKGYWKILITK